MPQGLRFLLPSQMNFYFYIDLERKLSLDDGKGKPPSSPSSAPVKREKQKSKAKQPIINLVWTIKAFTASFVITVVLSLLSGEVLNRLNIIIAFLILFLFIFIGIVFDMIGVAVTAAEEKPFHSMAARRISVGNTAVSLIKNAQKVSNVCCDIIGDISGVVSGATGAAIAVKLFTAPIFDFWGNLILTSFVAALIVGGKAVFKGVALRYSHNIVYVTAKAVSIFKRKDKRKK